MKTIITPQKGIETIKACFGSAGEEVSIPLMRAGKYFTAYWNEQGVFVSNLDTQPLLPWAVFKIVIELGLEKGVGVRINKGKAMTARLGEIDLEFDTVEGRVAQKVFGQVKGASVFRKVSPIVGILVWSGIFENGRGYIKLKK